METLAVILPPLLMGLAAVGIVLMIKTTRRTQGTRDPRHTEAVPVNPMSPEHARRLRVRYGITVAIVCGVLLLVTLAAR